MTDIRTAVEAHLDGIPADPERMAKLQEALDLALGQSKTVWRLIECPHCRRKKKHEIDFPNPAAIARALRDLVEMTKGKVPEQVTVRHEFDTLHIQELPTEELHRLAERVVDAEFAEVEPAALPPA